ncbi:HEAT repeat domain-containing protein [Candidatus Poribacteria bacterium]|nr:HEAT repeat domain-containing protein [Candidatus Poribacteria bacterium]MBT5533871.1 HEAT repeat domain-containing protein [Candidatus Poribacteria bacterium]MBT5712687.1 HEAT repeat domain-containing protein [Candidatus Poribacteria bacterium]MBT7098295.1 HEAT repeat domain-containing protein [Candidatus Poribacteria bacterium]MBT7806785.1 HEAT repeat domain-containing protein [Candidatus Poribacteria bacterium]
MATHPHPTLGARPRIHEVRDYYLRPDILRELYRTTRARDVTFVHSRKGRPDVQRPLLPDDAEGLADAIREVLAGHARGLGEHPYADRFEPYPWFTVGCDTGDDEVISGAYGGDERRLIGWESGVELDHPWRRSFAELYGGLRVCDDYGLHYRLKFSGRTSLHVIFPAEAMPEAYRDRPVRSEWETAINRAGRFVADRCPPLRHGWDAMGAGLMYSAPYSVHRRTGLVAAPLTRADCADFEPWMAAVRLAAPLPGWWDVPVDAGANFGALLTGIQRSARVFDMRPMASGAPASRSAYVPIAIARARSAGTGPSSGHAALTGAAEGHLWDEDPYVAQAAADALAGDVEGRARLLRIVGDERQRRVAQLAMWTLAAWVDACPEEDLGELTRFLSAEGDLERRGAVRVLRVSAHRVAGHVAGLLSDADVAVCAVAITTLLELGAVAEPYLREIPGASKAIVGVRSEEQATRGSPRAVALAAALGDDVAPHALAVHLDSGDSKARYFAAQALTACNREGLRLLVDALAHPVAVVRRRACEALRDSAPPEARASLVRALTDSDVKVRQNAARALYAIGGADSVDALRPLRDDPSRAVRRTVLGLIAR